MKLRLLSIAAVLLLATAAFAQIATTSAPKTTSKSKSSAAPPVRTVTQDKNSVLRPPAGQPVAIVIFEDLQCPDCARAHPLVYDIARQQKVPVVRHDFPLPKHNWSFDAAVWARYFDSKSEKLGNAFREHMYTNQPAITPENLLDYVRKFAQANNQQLPFLMDPNQKFESAVKADYALGQKIGIQHTPTIWVVGNTRMQATDPFIEVVDRSRMSEMIDQMRAAVAAGK